MNCEQVELELLGYHFGTVSLETRAELERHLPGCPRCLNAFFALKRELETQPELPPPSDAARLRLSRVSTVLWGVLLFVLATVMSRPTPTRVPS